MISRLTAHQRELEAELQQRVQAFFDAHGEAPGRVSIRMQLSKADLLDSLSQIHILVKQADTGTTGVIA